MVYLTILAVTAIVGRFTLAYQKAGHLHQYILMDKSAAQRYAFVGLTSSEAPATVTEEATEESQPEAPQPGQYL